MSNKEELKTLLENAKQKVEEASDLMQQAARLSDQMDTGYNMSGNMRAYVINYLTGGIDCIADKIDNYMEQTDEIEEDSEDAFFMDSSSQQKEVREEDGTLVITDKEVPAGMGRTQEN